MFSIIYFMLKFILLEHLWIGLYVIILNETLQHQVIPSFCWKDLLWDALISRFSFLTIILKVHNHPKINKYNQVFLPLHRCFPSLQQEFLLCLPEWMILHFVALNIIQLLLLHSLLSPRSSFMLPCPPSCSMSSASFIPISSLFMLGTAIKC